MFRNLMTIMTMLVSFSALSESDLTLEGERWEAKATGYVCSPYGKSVTTIDSHAGINLVFSTITTDYTLDNGLIKGTFQENGELCRYSALLLADNAASTIRLVKSKAFSPDSEVDCQVGRALIDRQLEFNDYWYWGHPHHLSIVIPANEAKSICGENDGKIGLDFVVSRFIGERRR